jgi:TPR repeat protein
MDDFDSPSMLEAVEELERKDYLSALALLLPLADAGNPKALCNLANLYHFGWGVEADGKKAAELYRKVASQNIRQQHLSGIAYQNLATLYVIGAPGVEPDCEKAAQYRKLAIEAGFDM